MKIVTAQFGPRAPADLPAILRELADQVEAGQVVRLVAAYVIDDEFTFQMAGSMNSSLELSTLLQRSCVDKYL